MRFFIPAARDDEHASEIYEATKAHIGTEVGDVTAEQIYRLRYRHDARDLVATVGEPHPINGELVVAIFRSTREGFPFSICTGNRGVLRGGPILAPNDYHAHVTYFTAE